jgi:hypothetical protein
MEGERNERMHRWDGMGDETEGRVGQDGRGKRLELLSPPIQRAPACSSGKQLFSILSSICTMPASHLHHTEQELSSRQRPNPHACTPYRQTYHHHTLLPFSTQHQQTSYAKTNNNHPPPPPPHQPYLPTYLPTSPPPSSSSTPPKTPTNPPSSPPPHNDQNYQS